MFSKVYHTNFWPLEWTVAHKPHDICYAKLICNKADKERVVGFHVAGPNAGQYEFLNNKLRAYIHTQKSLGLGIGFRHIPKPNTQTRNLIWYPKQNV